MVVSRILCLVSEKVSVFVLFTVNITKKPLMSGIFSAPRDF